MSKTRLCPRCQGTMTGAQDFQSGIYYRNGRLVRLHRARFRMRCLDPRCRHTELIHDHSKLDDVWLTQFNCST